MPLSGFINGTLPRNRGVIHLHPQSLPHPTARSSAWGLSVPRPANPRGSGRRRRRLRVRVWVWWLSLGAETRTHGSPRCPRMSCPAAHPGAVGCDALLGRAWENHHPLRPFCQPRRARCQHRRRPRSAELGCAVIKSPSLGWTPAEGEASAQMRALGPCPSGVRIKPAVAEQSCVGPRVLGRLL